MMSVRELHVETTLATLLKEACRGFALKRDV
jgi:hypothetical protein